MNDGMDELIAEINADQLREARALRAAARAVCPTCHEIGGHRYGCPACPEDDDTPLDAA